MDLWTTYIVDPWRLAPDIALWTVVLGTLVATVCGWVGVFLILRGQALVGDAISHTALLGIVVAYLITGSLTGWGIVIGAAVTGVLTVLLIEGLPRWGEVREDAATGIVFTTLFALGVVLLGALGHNVHLDTAHVLFGDIALALVDTTRVAGVQVPVVVLQLGLAAVLCALTLLLGWKELVVTTFDPAFASTRGLPVKTIRYGLVALLSLLVTSAFTSAGAILVVAFLIAPGATALLLTARLPVVMAIIPVLGLLSSISGMHLAYGANVSTGGAMACAACGLFGIAFLFNPREGLVTSRGRRFRQQWRTAQENAVRLVGRRETLNTPLSWNDVRQELGWNQVGWQRLWTKLIPRALVRKGWVVPAAPGSDSLCLSPAGRRAAERIERAHRLWETYLVERVGLPADHVHPSAEDLEHTLDEPLLERVNDDLGHPERDPHGSPIPRPVAANGTFQLASLRLGELGVVTAAPAGTPDPVGRSSSELRFHVGDLVEVLGRNTDQQTWIVRDSSGQLHAVSHADADAVWVRPADATGT